MSLYKRGRVWWSYLYVDGIRHQQSTGTKNRRHAELIEQKLRDDIVLARHQVPTADPDMTFNALAAYFIANNAPKPHHLEKLKVLLPFFGPQVARTITKGMVREYRAARHQAKKLSEATVNRDVAVLRHVLYWAVDEGYLLANPVSRLRLVAEHRTPRPVLTIAEEHRLAAAASGHIRELLVMALDTGMRRGELLHQRWEQVDLVRRVLQVSRSKTLQGEGREIPLTTRVVELLTKRAKATGTLFTYRGHTIGTIKTGWGSAVRAAGIRHIRFHDLRHAFATRLLEAGILAEVRKALMGHVSGQGIHGVYTHIELPLKRDAITKLEAWLTTERQRQASADDSTFTTQQEETA